MHGVCGDKAGDLRHEPGEEGGRGQCAQVALQRLAVGPALVRSPRATPTLLPSAGPLPPSHPAGGVYGPAGVQATYTAGQVITISLLVTAQHGGRHTFRICDRANADEACLYANVLQR